MRGGDGRAVGDVYLADGDVDGKVNVESKMMRIAHNRSYDDLLRGSDKAYKLSTF